MYVCPWCGLYIRRLIGRMQEMQEEKRALRAEVAAEQAETEQLRLLVRPVSDVISITGDPS